MLNIRLEVGMTDSAKRICTAIVMQSYKDYLSQNDESYWAYLPEYGIEIKIGKQSTEGQHIATAVRAKSAPSVIESILFTIALDALQPCQVKDLLADQYDRGFKAGKNAIRETFACLMTPE